MDRASTKVLAGIGLVCFGIYLPVVTPWVAAAVLVFTVIGLALVFAGITEEAR
jgi:hypothetical protein